MDFLNSNAHDVYVRDPERQHEATAENSGLLRVGPREKFSVTGRLADEAATVPGVLKASSKEAKEFTKKGGRFDQDDLMMSSSGPDVFPVPEEERGVRSGLHITGRDSGVPVAADVEPGDTKDGSGEDKFKGVAAVEDDDVKRGDVPQAVKDEPSAKAPADASDLTVKELRKLAKQRNVDVPKKAKKADLVAALEAPVAGGGGGGVQVQTEEASRTEKSEAVGEPGGTLTTDKDPSTGSKKG